MFAKAVETDHKKWNILQTSYQQVSDRLFFPISCFNFVIASYDFSGFQPLLQHQIFLHSTPSLVLGTNKYENILKAQYGRIWEHLFVLAEISQTGINSFFMSVLTCELIHIMMPPIVFGKQRGGMLPGFGCREITLFTRIKTNV